jgi:hypothetical protein
MLGIEGFFPGIDFREDNCKGGSGSADTAAMPPNAMETPPLLVSNAMAASLYLAPNLLSVDEEREVDSWEFSDEPCDDGEVAGRRGMRNLREGLSWRGGEVVLNT